MRPLSVAFILLLLSLPGSFHARGAEDRILFQEDFQKPLGERWKHVKFHEPTEYRIVPDGTNNCLMGFAKGGCSAFATKVELAAEPGIACSWRWKIDHCPKDGLDDSIAAFDHSARVFVAFDTWIGPPRTINYLWANRAATNSTFDHPLSSRTKFIVVESGNEKAGQWLVERRDLQKDWKLLFKDEPMPKIVGVGVFTDSHHTGAPITGWYEDIELSLPKPNGIVSHLATDATQSSQKF
jgi:hypothetical protein